MEAPDSARRRKKRLASLLRPWKRAVAISDKPELANRLRNMLTKTEFQECAQKCANTYRCVPWPVMASAKAQEFTHFRKWRMLAQRSLRSCGMTRNGWLQVELQSKLHAAARRISPMRDETCQVEPCRAKSCAGVSKTSEVNDRLQRPSEPCENTWRHTTALLCARESCENKTCNTVDMAVVTTMSFPTLHATQRKLTM